MDYSCFSDTEETEKMKDANKEEQVETGFKRIKVAEVAPFGVKEEVRAAGADTQPQTIPEIEAELAKEEEDEEPPAVVTEIVDPPPPGPVHK